MPLYEGVNIVADRYAVIIDLGSAYTKCGFATELCPRFIIPSEVYDWQSKVTSKVVDFSRPRDSQYDLFVKFFFQIYFKKLLVNPKERRLLLLESVLSPTEFRNLLAEVLFNHFDVPSIVFLPSHLAACFPLGTQSALVVDVGYKETLVLPIYEGIPLLNCWEASSVGQRKILDNLNALLSKYGEMEKEQSVEPLSSDASILNEELLEDIKVRTCFVTQLSRGCKIQSVPWASKDVSKQQFLSQIDKPPPDVKYPLSGQRILHVPGFIRESATETLFVRDVDDKSISQLIFDAVLKCPIDLRRFFLSRILVVGGTSMCLGFMDRLKADLLDLVKDPEEIYHKRINVEELNFFHCPVKQNYMVWLGGSIFGGLEILPHRSITKEQYRQTPEIPDWTDVKNNEYLMNGGGDHTQIRRL